ncbi:MULTISPECIES: ABC transporter ATP-binding protein [unclassified Streptomyces]|uniref:ABC transporter ATP-binding protein n=1 Tax=unclassified Streptomyces TaxID=2593676 RepID=UPI000DBA2749|nr:ABC transporter ATP-binding protein [Streptomyces sp. PsTaAH-137]MYT74649.1 ATP-binding cassette domain-containing protein [Streptomyces sp. SID8367]RAJ91633.1 taurine transport system ATP-binding protein [Streptomyces sp. PsTaAH-137]
MPRVEDDGPESDVELSGVSVRYGTAKAPVTAVADVSLSVGPGEFVVLVGPSGCGKTTLLRLIAGFERPAAGSVEVRRKVGVVFQQPRLFPWRTVGGNLSFALARHGVARAERAARAEELLTLVGLSGMAGRRTWELSGGQQQRVAIARALAAEPQILLMDEPFAALDALTRERLQEEVRTLAAVTGATVVFVTHSAEEAVLLGSRVVVMAAGPGRVVDELPVPLPRAATTDVAALRGDARFAELRAQLAAVTRDASAQEVVRGTP